MALERTPAAATLAGFFPEGITALPLGLGPTSYNAGSFSVI